MREREGGRGRGRETHISFRTSGIDMHSVPEHGGYAQRGRSRLGRALR
jgi:hypothetical protein